MDYNFREIEQKWQKRWVENGTYRVVEDKNKKKFYVLNMFPYPLNPMGYDAYGLPAEQYAIQTGQHPEKTTFANIDRYREQLDKIGFSFDWDREVRTCDPIYYKWTQWAFQRMFKSYYSTSSHKAQPTIKLIEHFELMGTENCNALGTEELHFTASDWAGFSEKKKQEVLMNYRIAYLAETMVNWCPALGTVLANDEVINGVSERGGYPVEQKKMRQWCLRVSAYAQRLLDGLEEIDWTDSLKETQRNWIGRSEGTEVEFNVADSDKHFTIFTTRADTMFGVTFMVLAPESELVADLTTADQKEEVAQYLDYVKKRTERERQMDHKVLAYSQEVTLSIRLQTRISPSGFQNMCWLVMVLVPSWLYLLMTLVTMPLPSTSTCRSSQLSRVPTYQRRVSMPKMVSCATLHQISSHSMV